MINNEWWKCIFLIGVQFRFVLTFFENFLIDYSKILISVCNCSPYGSVRSDCEQMSGKCICKPGISGDKCDTCPDGTSVTLKGCEGCKLK